MNVNFLIGRLMQPASKVRMTISLILDSPPMRHICLILSGILLLTTAMPSVAEDPVDASDLQQQVNQKYRNYFGADSQALLPFNKVEVKDWKILSTNKVLKRIYTEPDKFYNSKVYTFTLYQAAEDGSYYLDAKGGFWGMDELIYGPISKKELGESK